MNIHRVNFVAKYGKEIALACKGTGLFPSLMMAQAILESSGTVKGESIPGASKLARVYNNFFGIKDQPGDEWKGDNINIPTREVIKGKEIMINDYFRTYPDPFACFMDRNRFLKKNPRYEKAGVFKAKTPQEQAEALKKAGYATDPDYVKLLMGIINTYNLKSLDKM